MVSQLTYHTFLMRKSYKPNHIGLPSLRELARESAIQFVRLFVMSMVMISIGLAIGKTLIASQEFRFAEKPPADSSLSTGLKVSAEEMAKVEKWSKKRNCSPDGLPKGVIPAHAIIYSQEGGAQLTTFDEGWEVYHEKNTGRVLLAVCEN